MFDSGNDVEEYLHDTMGPAFISELSRLNRLDRWWRWDHDRPHTPRHSTDEYQELSARAQTPWLGLVVTSVAQALYVEGYRRAEDPDNATGWDWWQANRLDSRQIPVHRSALAYGQAYLSVLPGTDPLTGDDLPVMRGISPRRMVTFHEDEATDDWPVYAMHAQPATINGAPGWDVKVYDDARLWTLHADQSFDQVDYVTFEEHGAQVCPVVRFTNQLDLEGRTDGEVEPFIPIAGRIDQTVFDRLVVQRFSSWVVRTIAGMAPPEMLASETEEEYRERTKLRLRAEDILIADDPDTRFGSLPASPIAPFVDAHDADVRVLAAVSQTPPHHLLGQMANLSAEALAAAESSLMRKVDERQHTFGESWEQAFRLADVIMGETPDTSAQVQWADPESRSLAQAVDALAKLAGIGVPVELLLEKVPGWTQQDVERATALIEQGGSLDQLLADLASGQTSPDGADA